MCYSFDKISLRAGQFLKSALLAGIIVIITIWQSRAVDQNADETQESGHADSTLLTQRVLSPFDMVSQYGFVSIHSFSLDNYLEKHPIYVLSRRGPIGADTRLSRFGMGSGRCLVYLDGVPVNDPQNDVAPLALIPTTSVGGFIFAEQYASSAQGGGIEGVLEILPPRIPVEKPSTAIEISKGTNDIKQRRVRFSSIRSRMGLDLAYDELLNGGYGFDAREMVEGRGFGSFSSRIYSMKLRGSFTGGETYLFSFRKFTSAFQGDLTDPARESRRSGHLAIIAADLDRLKIRAFQREHSFSMPDSQTANQTLGASLDYDLIANQKIRAGLKAGAENITSHQTVRGAEARPRLNQLCLGTRFRYSEGDFLADIDVSLQHQVSHASGWGGRLAISRRLQGRHTASAVLSRTFRLPNLEELFLPLHTSTASDSIAITGNGELGSENALEAGATITSDLGAVVTELRVGFMKISDVIAPVSDAAGGKSVIAPDNGQSETLHLLHSRLRYSGSLFGFETGAGGGILLTGGEKGSFLSPVPHTRLSAAITLGREFFKPSSEILLTAEYHHSGPRRLGQAGAVPSYDVLHLRLDVRLVDAHLYMLLLNVLDKKYQTAWPYLMTPRTLVYGVEWTLFE